MRFSREKLDSIQEQFIQTYWSCEPYFNYVGGCGISDLRAQQWLLKDKFHLTEGESLDDLCLSVSLKENPPKDIEFPSDYRGVRIFYQVDGEAHPVKKRIKR